MLIKTQNNVVALKKIFGVNSMSILLFGATGHLARTKIVPAAQKLNMKILPVTRKPTGRDQVSHYSQKFPHCDITYMSLDSSYVVDVIDKVSKHSKICIEKPHGKDVASFNTLVSDIGKEVPMNNVYFVDHYLHKYIPDLLEFGIEEKYIKSITISLQETDSVEHRKQTFERFGMIKDIIQNHFLMALAEMFAKSYNYDRHFVLDQIELFSVDNVKGSQYTGYTGSMYTEIQCSTNIKLTTNDIAINFAAGKKQSRNEYSIIIETNDSKHVFQIQPTMLYTQFCKNSILYTEPFKNPDAYESVLCSVYKGSKAKFPIVPEIQRCWTIVEKII